MTTDEAIALLQRIRDRQEPAASKPESLAGLSFYEKDLQRLDLSNMDLSGCDFSRANLSQAQLFNSDLTNAAFLEADLSHANLTGATMVETNLNQVKAIQAGFGLAKLERCTAFQGNFELSTFSKATIAQSDFRCAILKNGRLRESIILEVDFTEADLRSVDMSLCDVRGTVFNNADLREARLRRIQSFTKAQWIGTDIRDINFAGAYMMRRFVMDQNYLKEFRSKNAFFNGLYYLWKITSDCGRSMTLWCFWIIMLILFFAWLYSTVGIYWGDFPTRLSPLYYSVVTFTTLGYGEVYPSSYLGQVVAMAEVIIGYLMLGGLLSILSNKMARRAD